MGAPGTPVQSMLRRSVHAITGGTTGNGANALAWPLVSPATERHTERYDALKYFDFAITLFLLVK
jgi:hypothetical protein